MPFLLGTLIRLFSVSVCRKWAFPSGPEKLAASSFWARIGT